MSNKYHISPGSGRANICRAKKKGCPLGADAPHFESKEEANAYVESKAKQEHSTIPTTMTKKGRGRPRKNLVDEGVPTNSAEVNVTDEDEEISEDEFVDQVSKEAEKYALKSSNRSTEFSERESRIMKKFVSTDKAFDKGIFEESLNYSLEAEVEVNETNRDIYGYDSYSDDDYDYYEDEVKYTGLVEEVNKDAVINQYYNELKNNFSDNELTDNEVSQAKGIIKKVLKKHDLFEDYNYVPVIEDNEVTSFTVLGDVDGAMADFKTIFRM